MSLFFFFFQAEDGIRDKLVTGVQTCALPISRIRSLQPASATSAARQKAANTRTRRIVCTSYMVSSYERRGEWGVVRDTPKAWEGGVVLDGAQRMLGSHRQGPLPPPTPFRGERRSPRPS